MGKLGKRRWIWFGMVAAFIWLSCGQNRVVQSLPAIVSNSTAVVTTQFQLHNATTSQATPLAIKLKRFEATTARPAPNYTLYLITALLVFATVSLWFIRQYLFRP